MNSITYRITGLVFSAIVLTVYHFDLFGECADGGELFQEYLMGQHMMGRAGMSRLAIMGQQEEAFLASVHHSLLWVGLAILIVELVVSYLLARSITVPLRKLSQAAEQIEQGILNSRYL